MKSFRTSISFHSGVIPGHRFRVGMLVATLMLSIGTARSGEIQHSPATNANNDDFVGAVLDQPNLVQGLFAPESLRDDYVWGVHPTGGITEYGWDMGAFFSGNDAATTVRIELGFGTGDSFVHAVDVAPGLSFDTTPPPASPAFAEIDVSPSLHEFTDGSILPNSFAGGLMQFSLDVPDLPAASVDYYTPEELENVSEGNLPFTFRLSVVPEPNSVVLLAGALDAAFLFRRRS